MHSRILNTSYLVLLLIFTPHAVRTESTEDNTVVHSKDVTRILDSFVQNYDQRVRPSYGVGHTISEIRYQWDKGPMSDGVSADISPPPFTILGYKQQILKIPSSTGNFSRLTYEIQFVRSIGYYLIQIYISSGFIVMVSWVSFWFKRNATLARVFVGVTAVLAITTVMSYTNAAVPKISYVKSIDVYLGVCFIMVFASLLESVTVDYMTYRMKLQKDTLQGVGNQDGAVNEAQETNEENLYF